ncbi:myrosinase 1-like [Epargyreus clarus]|uniref:myrosinase 1-like n=1 Tax=Epargyreus clarus TaxID=520877 RepID=UPI003C2C09DD
MLTRTVTLSFLLCTVCGKNLTFPAGFKFGAATSAYQIEGGWNSDGKGVNVWDVFVHHHPEMTADHSSGDVACDSYNLWEEDVRIATELGLDFYRFSISWSRILPTGLSNRVNEAGVKYYNNLIDSLLDRGIEPIITLFDFDLPKKIQDLGGWTNPLIADWFANYARIVFTLYADRVRTWITINEPATICDFAYNTGTVPPRVHDPYVAPYLCNKHVLVAHAKAWRIYDEQFKPLYGGRVSIANNLMWMEAKTKDQESLAELTRQNMVGRYSHPIYSATGGWPPGLEALLAENSKKEGYKKSRLPAFTEQELALVKGSYDFYAFNYYSSRLVRQTRPGESSGVWFLDGAPELKVKLDVDRNWPMGAFKDLPVVRVH